MVWCWCWFWFAEASIGRCESTLSGQGAMLSWVDTVAVETIAQQGVWVCRRQLRLHRCPVEKLLPALSEPGPIASARAGRNQRQKPVSLFLFLHSIDAVEVTAGSSGEGLLVGQRDRCGATSLRQSQEAQTMQTIVHPILRRKRAASENKDGRTTVASHTRQRRHSPWASDRQKAWNDVTDRQDWRAAKSGCWFNV